VGTLLDALFRLPGVDAPPVVAGERIRLIRPPALPDTEWILAAGSARLWRVFHEDYELCVLPAAMNARRAGATYTYRTWDIACEPAAAYLLEPDTLHTNHRILGPANYYVIKVARSKVADLASELGLPARPHFRSPATDDVRVMGTLSELSQAVAVGGDPLAQETLLLAALRLVLTGSGEQRPRKVPEGAPANALERVRDLLHARAAEAVCLDDLVAASGLSRFHLVRSFAKRFGAPPHAYLAQLRAALARRQLAAGASPSTVDAGFYDQSHLGRHFKRAYAVTPAAYRRAFGPPAGSATPS
jgi:AraC-like DNA-binding protein